MLEPSQLLVLYILAAQPDEDFVPVNESDNIVTFSRNNVLKCLRVDIVDDNSVEKTESFSISLERTENLDGRIRISPDRGRVTIEDDDGECNICNECTKVQNPRRSGYSWPLILKGVKTFLLKC